MSGEADEISERVAGDLPVRSAADVAASIPPDGTLAVSGFGSVGYPKVVPAALAELDREQSLTVLSGGNAGPVIDGALFEAGAVERRYAYQSTAVSRAAVNDGEVAFLDGHVSQSGDRVAFGDFGPVDVAVVEAAAVGEDWFVPGLSLGPVPSFVVAADELVVEVNERLPRELDGVHDVYTRADPPNRGPIPLSEPGERIGSGRVTFPPEKLRAVVRTERRDDGYSFREPTATDEAIADNLVDLLLAEVRERPVFAETVNLQFGVGSLGNALLGALDPLCDLDRTVNYYGEVIQDGLLDLLDAGKLGAASATSLALSDAGQDRLFADVETYAEQVVLRPTAVSNSPDLANRFGVIAVNSAVEADVYGHVNSTHVGGSQLLNGLGGSGDFNRSALLSITALPSTAKDGTVSRIVPMVTHVDHTEHDVDVLITEQGVADLRGLAPRERAELVVEECAHPAFRPSLRSYLARATERGGHEPQDMERVFDWQRPRE